MGKEGRRACRLPFAVHCGITLCCLWVTMLPIRIFESFCASFARHSAWRNNASTLPFNSQTRKLRTSVCFLKSSSISNVVIVGACDCRCIGGMPGSLLQNSENRLTKEGVRLNRMRLKETILEPYPGPRPFEKNERSIFFGRNEEIADLRNLCMAYPVVVLYSQSGA